MRSLTKELKILRDISELLKISLNQIYTFVVSPKFVDLARDHEQRLRARDVDVGLNLFTLISDIYHRENLHSDILLALLDPAGSHNEGHKYLHSFLEFIRSKSNDLKINLADYANATVVREKQKIDLLIKDVTSKKAIIIENKINGAKDQSKQLPRYLNFVKNAGYDCTAIVYLRLNREQDPDRSGWNDAEQTEVDAKLIRITAYDETPNDLLNGWIYKCANASTHLDASLILRQYGTLITKLGGNLMNKQIMEKFYLAMQEGENLKTALSLKSLLDDMVRYRIDRIIENFKGAQKPFPRIGPYQNAAIFDGLQWNSSLFQLGIWVEPESYFLIFWDINFTENGESPAKFLLQKMNYLDDFNQNENKFQKEFRFPSQEAELVPYIQEFNEKLKQLTIL